MSLLGGFFPFGFHLLWIFRVLSCVMPVLLACWTVLFTGNACWWWRLDEHGAQRETVCCSAKNDTEDWVWGKRESGESHWKAYLVVWQACTVVKEGYLSQGYDSLKMRWDKTRWQWSLGSRRGMDEGKEVLQLMFCFSVRWDPKNLFLESRERGESIQAVHLMF